MRGQLLCTALILAVAGCAHNDSAVETTAVMPVSQGVAIASTKQLMLATVIPASDAVFGAAANPPKDDAAWTAVYHQAMVLAESGNLLMRNGLRIDQPEWLAFSKQLNAAAIDAAKAAQEKDVDKLSDAGNAMYEACDGCHQKYMAARAQ